MIRKIFSTLTISAALMLLVSPASVLGQASESAEPFKVGTFAVDDTPFVGLVMRDDNLIVDVADANRAMELMPAYSSINVPDDMLGFIEPVSYTHLTLPTKA